MQNAAQVGIVENEESTGPNKENGEETPRGLKMKQDALAQKKVKMSSELQKVYNFFCRKAICRDEFNEDEKLALEAFNEAVAAHTDDDKDSPEWDI